MEAITKKVVILLALMVAIPCWADAQSICNVTVPELLTCKPAATPPNPPPPTRACCAALSHADLVCLCQVLKLPNLPQMGIDPKLAIQLPEKCRIPHPPTC